jgi:hypothetical protein
MNSARYALREAGVTDCLKRVVSDVEAILPNINILPRQEIEVGIFPRQNSSCALKEKWQTLCVFRFSSYGKIPTMFIYVCVCSGLQAHDSKINRYLHRGRILLVVLVICSSFNGHPLYL